MMKKIILLFLCFAFMSWGHSIFAAENETQDNPSQKTQGNETQDSTIEEMESVFEEATTEQPVSKNIGAYKVIGSRIKRIELEGTSPVTIWTKEDLDNSGYFSLSEFFTNTSLSNFGGVQVHSRSTLTLINGSRMVFGEAGDYVNTIPKRIIDIIPNSAIERVEILKDGASALYGSDVVGGVVNIITKKDFDSTEFSLKLAPTLYPFYKGGSQADASAVFGKTFNSGHFISTLQFQYSDSIKALDRKGWYGDYFVGHSPNPSFHISKENIVNNPNCPEKLKIKKDSAVIGCKHNLLPYRFISPNIYNFSSYNYVEYQMNSNISLYSQWLGFWHRSTTPDQYFYADLELPEGHKMSQGNGSAGTLKYLFEGSDKSADSIFLDGLAGAKGYLSKTWDFDLNLKWSSVWDRTTEKDYLYKEDLTKAIVSSEVFDPFDPKKRDLSSVRKHDVVYKNHDTKLFSSLDFSGETGWWDTDLAVGLQAYYNNYTHTFDPEVEKGKIFAKKPGKTKSMFERTVLAAYMEGIKSFSDWLEVQIAGRVDHYSDFGWTVNPKLAVRFQPSSQFLIRSSVGTAFEAPNLIHLYTPAKSGDIWIYDAVACYNQLKEGKHFEPIHNSLTGKDFKSQKTKDKLIREFLIEQSSVVENKKLPEAVKAAFKGLTGEIKKADYCNKEHKIVGISKGNKNLKETRALTASLGFHWQVHEDHSLTVDGWFNSLSGVPLVTFDSPKTTEAELRYGKKYVEKQGVEYERDETAPYSPIKNPVESYVNVSGKNLSGVDLRWESDFPNWNVANGYFYFNDDFSSVITSGVENFKGMGYVNNLGKSFGGGYSLPRWKNFATLGWKSSKHNISLVLKSMAGVKKLVDESEKLPMNHIVDLFYQYNMNPKTSLKLGWYNLLFSDPLIDDTIAQGVKFNRYFFDSRGPRFFVELRRTL